MIAIGCDHGALELKEQLIEHLKKRGVECKDYGTYTKDSCDYPVYAKKVAEAILSGECEEGILLCGTGIGMSMAARKQDESHVMQCFKKIIKTLGFVPGKRTFRRHMFRRFNYNISVSRASAIMKKMQRMCT